MTIRKGQEWGHFEERPSDLQLVADDVAACEVISKCVIESSSCLNLSISKSDMARTLGITGANNLDRQMLCTKFDVMEASAPDCTQADEVGVASSTSANSI